MTTGILQTDKNKLLQDIVILEQRVNGIDSGESSAIINSGFSFRKVCGILGKLLNIG